MKKHYQDVLFKNIASVILLPTLLVGCVLVFYYYERSLDKVENDLEWESKTAATSVYNSMLHVKYDVLSLVANEAFAEVTQNILFSQYVSKELQFHVEQNPFISASIILDNSDFIIEGYPVSSLKVHSKQLAAIAKSYIQHNPADVQANLYYIDDIELKDKTLYSLAYVTPLQKRFKSIVKPFETMGVMVTFINIDTLLKELDHNTGKLKYLYHLMVKNIELPELEMRINASFITTTTGISIPVWLGDEQLELSLKTYQNRSDQDYAFVSNLLVLLFLFLMILLLLLFFIKRFSEQVNKPLEDVIALSRTYSQGNYQAAKIQSPYIEFDELANAMTQMAKQIEQQMNTLKQAKDIAEHSERLKSQFLANMSHEIRTPMNGVLGMLQLIHGTELTSTQKDWLEKAQFSAKNLLDILNEILDFSKIEAGKVVLELREVNLVELVETILSPIAQSAKDKSIDFNLTIDSDFAPVWVIDPTRFSQILLNFASNALKFTEQGEINVLLKSDGEDGFTLTVQDTGIGMTQAQLAKVFNVFEQADPSTTRKYGGTGLGLAITKGLVELMKGQIDVESELGKGSCFSVSIKAKLGNNKKIASAKGKLTIPDLSGIKVLIAEDNEINKEILNYMVSTTNAEIFIADDGLQAIEAVENFQPDVILMDVQMPNMDGIEAVKKIRQAGINTPIYMQTANVMAADTQYYLEIGANGYLVKPIDLALLYQLLGQFSNKAN